MGFELIVIACNLPSGPNSELEAGEDCVGFEDVEGITVRVKGGTTTFSPTIVPGPNMHPLLITAPLFKMTPSQTIA